MKRKRSAPKLKAEEVPARIVELSRTMPESNARRQVRKEFTRDWPGITGKALTLALDGVGVEQQINDARRTGRGNRSSTMEASATTPKERKKRGPNPKSNATKIVTKAVKLILSEGKPLTRAELDKRIKSATVSKPSAYIRNAWESKQVIDGHIFTRPERATYGVEPAPAPEA